MDALASTELPPRTQGTLSGEIDLQLGRLLLGDSSRRSRDGMAAGAKAIAAAGKGWAVRLHWWGEDAQSGGTVLVPRYAFLGLPLLVA